MPNPKLETYKNKATGTVYDYTDAAAQAALADILDGTDIDSFGDVETALATKVDEIIGKGLSTNDYDDTEKTKVAGAFPRSEQAVLGAKNILKNDGAPSQSRANTSWTKNTDGSVTVSTTGSASGDSDYHLNNPTSRPISEIKNGMIMTAVEHDGDSYSAFNNKFYLCIIYRNSSDGYISQQSCVDGPVILNIPNNAAYYRMSIAVYTGAEIDNATVYPMISFDGGEYVPHAMTNKELTPQENTTDGVTTSFTFDTNGKTLVKQGNIVLPYIRVTGVTVTANDDSTPICVLAEGYRPRFSRILPVFASGQIKSVFVNTNGKIVSSENLSNSTVTIMIPWTV